MNPEQYSASDVLHAFADGQLDVEQSRHVLSLLENDLSLQKELCEIQRIKHMVQIAYPQPESARKAPGRQMSSGWRHAAGYVLAFSLTLVAGAVGNDYYLSHRHAGEGITLNNAAAADDNRFIVFIDSHEPAKLEGALSQAEHLAEQVESKAGSVYVVASSEGIDLLRLGTTKYEGRIFQMSQEYPHLRFVACSNTLYNFKQRGEMVELVDGTEIAPSAVEFVVQHLRQGWRYIAI